MPRRATGTTVTPEGAQQPLNGETDTMNPDRRSGLVALISTMAASVGLALGMIVPGASAVAAPSTHQQIQIAEVGCAHLIAGDAQAYFSPMLHSVFGPDADLQLWLEPDDIIIDAPTIVSGAADFTAGAGDSGLSGTFELLDLDDFSLVGIGTLEVQFTPNGDVHEGGPPKSTGNERLREQLLTQPMIVTGTLTLDLEAYDRQIVMSLDECSGSTVDIDVFFNDPASSVNSFQITVLSCVIVTEDIVLQLAASDDLGLVSAEGVVHTATASYPITSTEGVTLTLSSFGMSSPLEAAPGGGQGVDGTPGGTLTATAKLTKQPKVAWTDQFDGTTFRFVQQDLSVAGSIVIAFDDGRPLILPMSDANCYAFDYSMRSTTKP